MAKQDRAWQARLGSAWRGRLRLGMAGMEWWAWSLGASRGNTWQARLGASLQGEFRH